jgi:tRNA threonylcarbamoyladenosine biosynthesis protein TsaE
MIQVLTRSPEETRTLGKTLGSFLDAPLTCVLSGDLGSGKTVFVQGLADGLGVAGEAEVTSPSFALVHEHMGRFPLFHVDLFRLEREIDLEGLGLEEILDGRAVVVVEWGEKLSARHLDDHLHIRFEIVSDTQRRIGLIAHGPGAEAVLGAVER